MPAMLPSSEWDQCPGEDLCRRRITQYLPGPVIDPVLHCPDLGFRHHAEVRPLREALADQAVGVFVQTEFPGKVGVRILFGVLCLVDNGTALLSSETRAEHEQFWTMALDVHNFLLGGVDWVWSRGSTRASGFPTQIVRALYVIDKM